MQPLSAPGAAFHSQGEHFTLLCLWTRWEVVTSVSAAFTQAGIALESVVLFSAVAQSEGERRPPDKPGASWESRRKTGRKTYF